uniref:Uncharacterized protein LOC105056020 n=1 Tax=Elaeis guineensis var. tenera TaxID=51953 RepID=A0A6J0PQD3_ELAGV|nr:uncharacterized protein LOC105056020 [Elaeis guineensis]XP_010936385.1 uncharacterized protein LOC105056020 [Elaeis guineensis]XP_019709918.1 uncharacterized protein LOC105056020 [Elaeis guineensis]
MGTKVQCKSYIPGYYPMTNLNKDSDSSWSRYHEDKTFSGPLYNGFKVSPVNEHSEYDKEMLKRTMLEHEAVFRKQVYELHRLYKVQKYLMDELKRKQSYRYSAPTGASHSNMFSSQMPHEVHGKVWQMPHQPLVHMSYSRASAPDADDKKPHMGFLKENNMQYTPISPENGGSLDDRPVDRKLKRPKIMFDLHLPADAYIDSEDAESTEKENVADSCVRAADPLNKIHGIEPEKNVKLTLGTSDDGNCREGSWKLDSHPRGCLSICSLADLNEPIKESDGEEAAGSVSNCLRTQYKEGHQLPMKSTATFVPRDIFMDGYRNEGSCSNFLHADKREIRQEWQALHNHVGKSRSNVNSFSSGSCIEKYPMSSESIQLKLEKANESHLPDQNKLDTYLREKTTQPTEIVGRNLHLVRSNHSVVTYSQMNSPLSVVSRSACSSATSPPVSSWRKPAHSISHIPIAVQALPCFNGSVLTNARSNNSNAQNCSTAADKLQCNGVLKSHSHLGSKFPNGLHNDLQLDSKSSTHLLLPSITLDRPNLNRGGDNSAYPNCDSHAVQKCLDGLQCQDNKSGTSNRAILNGILDNLTSKQDLAGKHDGPSKGLPWLSTKSPGSGSSDIAVCDPQMELGFTKDYSRLMSGYEKVTAEFASKGEKDRGSSLCIPHHYLSHFQIKENKIYRHEASDDDLNSNRIPDFPLLDKIQQSAHCSPVSCHKQSSADDTKFSEKGKGARNHCLGTRNNINLNSAIDEAESPPSLSIPGLSAKIACKIDLEAPIDAWEESTVSLQGKIMGMNHFKKLVESKDGSQETEFLHDTPLRVAAEIIISMSLDVSSHSNGITFCSSTPASCDDSLQWFAEVVISSAESGVSKGRGDGGSEPSDDDGMDSFESLTLKLEAMKEDEYMCRSWEQEKPKDEEASTASLLLTRPRRGQARKRRQRRDFQKDILPGLASLSRHEVAEDIQIFGSLMRASGQPWQAGSARRSTGRSGQTRGRRQPRSLAVVRVSPPPTQPTNTELEIGGTSMMGWGRTTRRCRRQRFTPGNASVPHE